MAESARKQAQNKKNLKPIRSTSEAREKGRAGGKRSGEVRREKKQLRELLEQYLAEPATVNGVQATRKDLMAVRAVKLVTEHEIGQDITPSEFARAFELIRDTIGERPQTQVEVATADNAKFTELLEQLETGD